MIDPNIEGRVLKELYGLDGGREISSRIESLRTSFRQGGTLISAPGRTELGGNHTDHNRGKVLCAAVQQDSLALARKIEERIARVHSLNLNESYEVSLDDLDPHPDEVETSSALLRGVLQGMHDLGGDSGGFDAVVHSTVGIGSGLSSSASFEVLLAAILNELFNDSRVLAPDLARIGQFAENEYFGKPCGLMDQMASALGGIQLIDFRDPDDVILKDVHFDFDKTEYTLATVNTGSSHDDLTHAYASIPTELAKIAADLGVEYLRNSTITDLINRSKELREKHGDRAVLRAFHFFHENDRVENMLTTLSRGSFDEYLSIVSASGQSSQNVLQNTVPPLSDGVEQGLAFALGLSQLFFEMKGRGVGRVHGGGFAGTMQVYVHQDDFDEFKLMIESVIGAEAIQILHLREQGACRVGVIP